MSSKPIIGHAQPTLTQRRMRAKSHRIVTNKYGCKGCTVIEIVSEVLRVNKVSSGSEIEDRVAQLLRRVGLRPEFMRRYPHAFRGGERQRIGIARALATNPRLIVADEAISALDVSIRAQILNLLEDLQDELGLMYLFIAHDLSVIRQICDRTLHDATASLH